MLWSSHHRLPQNPNEKRPNSAPDLYLPNEAAAKKKIAAKPSILDGDNDDLVASLRLSETGGTLVSAETPPIVRRKKKVEGAVGVLASPPLRRKKKVTATISDDAAEE